MARSWLSRSMVRWSSGLLASVAMVAAVTGVIVLLERHVPVLNLLVLYLLAVLPIAIFWGSRLAAVTAVLSVVVFALFLPPRGSPLVADARNLAHWTTSSLGGSASWKRKSPASTWPASS